MGEMWGADLDQLRALAKEFDAASQSLDNTVSEVSSMLSSVAWLGPGGDQFRDEWDGQHSPSLRQASNDLARAKTTLLSNADDQEATSNELGGGGVGVPPGGDAQSPPRHFYGEEDSWWETLNNVIGGASWVASVGGVAQATAETIGRWGHGLWTLADDLPGRFGGAIGTAGKALGWLSVGFGAYQMGQGIAEGDYWKVGDGAITAGLGVGAILVGAALVSNPVGWAILGAGAAWALADVLIDGNVTEAIWNGASDAAGWAWDKGGDLVEGAADLASDAGDAISDAAGDVLDAGGDLVDGAKDLFSW